GSYLVQATATDQDNGTSPVATLTQTVNPDGTTTVVTSSVNPSILHQLVTFTAAVAAAAPGAGMPTGTLQFEIDGINFGSAVPLGGGSASMSTAVLPAGPHTITAVYGGDNNFLPGSGSLTQNVQYVFSGFLPPLNKSMAFGLNRTLPIKWQLTDVNGTLITSL